LSDSEEEERPKKRTKSKLKNIVEEKQPSKIKKNFKAAEEEVKKNKSNLIEKIEEIS